MKRYGQAILDYVILLAVVIVALLIMGYYVRNSLSAKLREGADAIGQGDVYRPGSTTVTTTVENK